MFNSGGVIRKRVMEKVEAKIAVVEEEYKNGCQRLEEKLEEDLESLECRFREDKEDLTDRIVEGIVAKIL